MKIRPRLTSRGSEILFLRSPIDSPLHVKTRGEPENEVIPSSRAMGLGLSLFAAWSLVPHTGMILSAQRDASIVCSHISKPPRVIRWLWEGWASWTMGLNMKLSLDHRPFEIRCTAVLACGEENPGKLRYTRMKEGMSGERRRMILAS